MKPFMQGLLSFLLAYSSALKMQTAIPSELPPDYMIITFLMVTDVRTSNHKYYWVSFILQNSQFLLHLSSVTSAPSCRLCPSKGT
jgi:hypothetical protein